MTEPTAVGRVAGLRSYPVKSLDAPELTEARVLAAGLEHDRGWAVVDADGEVVTARQVGALRDLVATAPDATGDVPVVSGGDPSDVVGRPVQLRPASGDGGFNEVAPVHLVSRQAVARAAADEGTTLGDPACSVDVPRANVVVELADDTVLETAWVGREVRLGDVVLRISKQPKHCLGVYADVVEPGTLRVGDEVRLG